MNIHFHLRNIQRRSNAGFVLKLFQIFTRWLESVLFINPRERNNLKQVQLLRIWMTPKARKPMLNELPRRRYSIRLQSRSRLTLKIVMNLESSSNASTSSQPERSSGIVIPPTLYYHLPVKSTKMMRQSTNILTSLRKELQRSRKLCTSTGKWKLRSRRIQWNWRRKLLRTRRKLGSQTMRRRTFRTSGACIWLKPVCWRWSAKGLCSPKEICRRRRQTLLTRSWKNN